MDSDEYDILERAVQATSGVPGFSCEIGVREGGASQLIMNQFKNRIHIGIDPYGDLNYRGDEMYMYTMDYSSDMQSRMLSNIYTTHPDQFIFFPMEDTEFFTRFADGIPIYRDGNKSIINEYAFVFIDGPHSLEDVRREFQFFKNKIPVGGAIVFDDIRYYPHFELDAEIADAGFEVMEHGKFKKSYKRFTLSKSMAECLYPLESKKPCGKTAIKGAPDNKYGPLCARHAREVKAAGALNAPAPPVRKVMIGTLSYDGRVDVRFVDALLNTLRITSPDVMIVPIYMSFDSLIQRARNDTVAMALNNGFDDLIFIDSDIEWDPTWIGKLLNYPVDVVGGTYRKKTDSEELYVIKQLTNPAPVDTRTGLMKVDGLGCGFIRLSRRAMQYLWDASEPYEDRGEKRMIFEVLVEDGDILSEDIYMCHKLNRGGIQVHLDPRMCCNHMGLKKYEGNFFDWYQRLLEGLKSKDDEKV